MPEKNFDTNFLYEEKNQVSKFLHLLLKNRQNAVGIWS